MDIEELAFKDRKTLAQLNEEDLLDIIVFLQFDRKQWINQFSKTHNDSVDIRKENLKLKLELSGYRQAILNNKEMLGLKEQNDKLKEQLDKYENPEDMTLMMMWCTEKVKDENQDLKKQLEDKEDYINKLQATKDKLDKWDYENTMQQKEFIKWLENGIERVKNTEFLDERIQRAGLIAYNRCLRKYKKITQTE